MKNQLLVLMIIITGSFMWPFSCEGQTVQCDPVYVDDPKQTDSINQLQKDLSAELDKNDLLVKENASKDIQITSLNKAVMDKANQITILENDVSGLKSEVIGVANERDAIKVELAECIARPNGIDTVYVDSDSITVGGITYLVEDIELILPKETIDTITVTTCFEDYMDKQWFHVGDPKEYPHRIYFPTKELEIIGIMFTDSLTMDMKKYQTQFKIQRTRNHELGSSSYKNLYIDPVNYLPKL